MKRQQGYIAIVLIVFALLIGLMIFPMKFPTKIETQVSGTEYCRPDPPGQEVTLQATALDEQWGEKIEGTMATYTRVKSNVPIDDRAINEEHSLEGDVVTTPQGKLRIYYAAPINGKTIDKWKGRVGESEQFYWVNGYMDRGISLARHGIIFALHIDEAEKPVKLDLEGQQFYLMDIYKDQSRPILPPEVYQCLDIQTEPGAKAEFPSEPPGAVTVTADSVIVPPQDVARPNDQLQLEWFKFGNNKFLHHAWWYPVCKPAVYLYPREKTLVNVKVFPEGYLTYVDPVYDPVSGWTVEAYPDGDLYQVLGSKYYANPKYDYLYYESKIRDEAVEKPTRGWVVKGPSIKGQVSRDMDNLFRKILPELGLNRQQEQDFVEYWNMALPEAPYYFVGVVSQENVDRIERLEITPKPDYINRVRIYFERLDSFKKVEAPDLTSNQMPVTSSQFRVVEWGGMVKNDLNHPFTCSQ